MILGIDEVGRGPWAGPLVVGAVVLNGAMIDGLTDSKKLTKKRREQLNNVILDSKASVGLGWVQADEIDRIGLSQSLVAATKRAVEQIDASYHEIIIDGTINFLADTTKGRYVTTMKKADLLIPSVSAASIVAKVARDAYMEEQDHIYEGYGFKTHVGYGTAKHRQAIEILGVTPLHRLSIAPLAKYRLESHSNVAQKQTIHSRTTKEIGDNAEEAVADHLQTKGHEVLERNWKTKFCEIDIVTRHNDTIYFTEVKYRNNDRAGGGLAAITSKKLRQMKFAAEYYALRNKMRNTNLHLAVACVTGSPVAIESWMLVE